MVNKNALHNVTNPNQTSAKKVLCVCSAGLLRSPTTANVLNKNFGFNTRAAGLVEDYALIPVTDLLLYWADEIVCMEDAQKVELEARVAALTDYPKVVSIYALGVPDAYQWGNPNLEKLILDAYNKKDSNGNQ